MTSFKDFWNSPERKDKTTETILVIAMGLLLLGLIYDQRILMIISFAIGAVGIFIKALASLISYGWDLLSKLLSLIVPQILLGLIFFIFLTPLAFLQKIFKGDSLSLKRPGKELSMWKTREKVFSKSDLKNMW